MRCWGRFGNGASVSEIAPGDLKAGKVQLVPPQPHHLIPVVEDDADGVVICYVPLIDLALDHRVLATVSGTTHKETISDDPVPIQPPLRFGPPAILASRYQEHGRLGLPAPYRLIDEVDRLVDLVVLGAAGIIWTAVAEKGERAVQIEDHALAHRPHSLRHQLDTRGSRT